MVNQQEVRELAATCASIDARVGGHDDMLKDLLEKLARHELRVHGLDLKTSDLDQRLTSTSELARSTEERLNGLEGSLKDLQLKMAGLDSRLTGTDYLAHSNKDAAEHLKRTLQQIEEALRNKVDVDDFDNLRNYLQSGGKAADASQLQTEISSKDSNVIKQLKKKLDELQSRFDLQFSSGDRLEEIFLKIQGLEKSVRSKAESSDVEDLKSKSAKLRGDVDHLMTWFQELENCRSSDLNTSASTSGGAPDNAKLMRLARRVDFIEESLKGLNIPPGLNLAVQAEEIGKLWGKMDELKDKLDRLGKELLNRIKELEIQKSSSLSSSVLSDFERSILQRLDDLAEALGKKFADKLETRKALQHLDKLIKSIYGEHSEKREGDDALLARKPLGGWSCASCEKGLEKLHGRIAPYMTWNKMPYRDPADRIARVGPGFSRMLATVQPETMAATRSRQGNSKSRHVDYEYEDEVVNLPPVKFGERPHTAALP
jgi:hypothetical protein